MKSLFEFFKSRIFIRNVLAYLAFVVLLFVGLSIFLGSYTQPGQTFDVPDFVGDKVNIQDIDLYMKDKELTYEVVETVFRRDLPEGTVFFQQPGSTNVTGMQVKKNRSIKLRVSTRTKMVEMPDLAGKSSVRFAEQKLVNRGLKVKIEYIYGSEGKNQVLEQKFNGKTIESGTIVPFGSQIVLVVSKGKGDAEMELPIMIGLTICEARERLATVNVVASFVCIDCAPGNTDEECRAIIYVQEPDHEYFSKISVGESMVFKAWLVEPEDVNQYRQTILDIDFQRDPIPSLE